MWGSVPAGSEEVLRAWRQGDEETEVKRDNADPLLLSLVVAVEEKDEDAEERRRHKVKKGGDQEWCSEESLPLPLYQRTDGVRGKDRRR